MKSRDREKMRKAIMHGVEDVLDRVEDRYESVSERTSGTIGNVKERASDMYGSMKTKAAHTHDRTRKYVQENPEKSLLIAAGVGVLTALATKMIIKKSKRRHHFDDRY